MNADPELIEERVNLPWLPPGAILRTYLTSEESPTSITRVVLTLAFKGDQLLLINDQERGWDIPGGHVEPGETLRDALFREVREEATVDIELVRPFARMEVITPPGISNGNYPTPISCMLFYLAKVQRESAFNSSHETIARGFFPPSDARNTQWVRKHLSLYEAALREASQW